MKKLVKASLALAMVASMMAGCSKKGGDADATYTFNNYIGASSVQTLNPHEWEYSGENEIMGLTQSPLYDFIYSATADYEISYEMAAGEPEDITADLAGTYGIPEDATEGYAYRVPLRTDAKWDDGTSITAQDYIYSMKALLDADMQNYRASSWTDGQYALANAAEYFYDGACDFEDIGFYAEDDNTLVFVYVNPMTCDFNIYQGFMTPMLVKQDLYEGAMFSSEGLNKTSYGTSVDTYASFGPYKLKTWQADKEITLERNPEWFGWTDGDHVGQYQTTNITYQVVDDHSTQMLLFMQGNLDSVTLDATDLETYGTSDYVLYTPQSYTYKISFNVAKDALKSRETAGINKTIITYKDFREAFSLSLDRTSLVQKVYPSCSVAYGLLNDCYFYDPDTYAVYRDTDVAKEALMNTYNATSIDAVTGHDINKAKELYTSAYNAAVAAGDMQEGDKVVLEFNVNTISETVTKTINELNDFVTEATVGTPLEGKVSIEAKEVDDYYSCMYEGTADMIWSAWGGSDFDPYALMECYTMDYLYADGEGGFDNQIEWTATIAGEEVTKSFENWWYALSSEEYAQADVEVRLQVLAAIEAGILQQYNTNPVYSLNEATLLGQKVEYVTYDYNSVTGYGGTRFMTYNYTDAEWEDYCKSNNNQLTY